MKKCKRCGHEIPSHWKRRFCPYCGYGNKKDGSIDKRIKHPFLKE